jgi:hypothetical protein
MTEKQYFADVQKNITVRMETVAAERDKLDVMIDELTGLKDSCQRAYDDLWSARDALSELV